MNEPQTSATATARSENYPVALAALKAFFAAWKAASVYDENNAGYRGRRQELTDVLVSLREHGLGFVVVYQNDYFFFNGERLNYDRDFTIGRPLATRFDELGLGGITIPGDAAPEEIDRALFTLAQADRRTENPYAALSETWSTLGIAGVTITPLPVHASERLMRDGGAQVDPKVLRRRRAQALMQRSESVVQEFWEKVRDRNSFNASAVQRVVHQLIDEVAQDEEVLIEFAALKDFDEYTYYHSVNVAVYSIAVGMRLGLDRVRLAHLGLAALFHDIGKVKLPRDLISKPEEFDDNDWAQMKRHPMLGALTLAALRPIDAPLGMAMAGAFEHHLKMDLSGYPKLTRERTLHLFSRIITICDVFDAMTSGRVYDKTPSSPDEAVRRLIHRGRDWYDPLIMKAFVHVVGIFPIGTVGRLSDGTIAIVTRNDAEDLYAPEVLVIQETDGTPCRRASQLRNDESTPAEERRHIAEVLDAKSQGINIADYIGVLYRPEESDEPQSPLTET